MQLIHTMNKEVVLLIPVSVLSLQSGIKASNHLYWCAASAPDSEGHWKSLIYHICGIHD